MRLHTTRRAIDYPPPTPQPTPCRIWQGPLMANGRYGQRADGKAIHRWVVEQISEDQYGTSWDPTLFVTHLCDNTLCFRYDHLRLGTHVENMADMRSKERSLTGSANYFARLTPEQVLAIRADGRLHREIAEEYGVHVQTIYKIRARKTWRNI